MRSTTLGQTGLRVSRIAFGTWQLGGDWGSFDEEQATAAIRHAREMGITLFDTAQAYGFGTAERLLGTALREDLRQRREELVVATKGGTRPDPHRPRDAGTANLRQGVEESLRALDVDYIDVYQVHWPDPQTPAEETASVLQRLVDEGKVRHVGVSNYDADQMAQFEAIRPVETLQPPYHLFRRGIEDSILPHAREHDIGVLVYSALASGLLTGRWDEHVSFAADDWRSQATGFTGETLRTNLACVDRLKRLAGDCDLTVAQLALAWVLAQPGVHVAIVGSGRATSIESSAAAADVDLSTETLTEIERIVADGVPIGGAAPEGVA